MSNSTTRRDLTRRLCKTSRTNLHSARPQLSLVLQAPEKARRFNLLSDSMTLSKVISTLTVKIWKKLTCATTGSRLGMLVKSLSCSTCLSRRTSSWVNLVPQTRKSKRLSKPWMLGISFPSTRTRLMRMLALEEVNFLEARSRELHLLELSSKSLRC